MQVAGLNLLGKAHGPIHVLGEYAGRQAEPGIVSHRNGLVNVIEGTDRHRRTKQFFPGQSHIRLNVGHHRRGVNRAFLVTTGYYPRALLHRLANPPADPGGVGLADHRPHFDGLIQRVAGSKRLGWNLNGIQKIGVNPPVGQHPLGGNADLAGIGKTAGDGSRRHLLNISVRHDNQRAVGTQLHRHFFYSGVAANSVAHFHAAGEGNFAYPGVAGDDIANLRPGAGNALDSFRRQAGFQQDFGQLQTGQGSISGGLENDGIAGSQRRPYLVADQVQGEVKGGNGGYHAHRHPNGEPELGGISRSSVQRHRLAMQPLGLLGGKGDGLDGPQHLAPALGNDLALLHCDGAAQVFNPFRHQVGGAAQDSVPLVSGQFRHYFRAPRSAADSGINVGGVGSRHGINNRLVEGIVNGHGLGLINPVAVEVHSHDEFFSFAY